LHDASHNSLFEDFCASPPFRTLYCFEPDTSTDLPAAFIGKTISPGVEISYAGDTDKDKFENIRIDSTPVKTEVYPDGHEKFRIEDGMFKGFMGFDAEYHRSFYAGTQFKIANVKLNKSDVEMILAPVSAEIQFGDVKLVLGNKYATKTTQEIVTQINEMLKPGMLSFTAPRKGTGTGGPISLDCTPQMEMVRTTLSEVVFDEAAQTATFQDAGLHHAMQPATFTDSQIKWNNGHPGVDREFYSLSRTSGILIVKHSSEYRADYTYKCAVRAKQF
jgi:hypothetical protein